jgi:ATP-dependent Lon protease
LVSDISTRDRDGINKTFSGLFKILFPQGEATKEEVEMILKFAIEGRKRIKDQLMRIDNTYSSVRFCYVDNETKKETYVKTLEEEQYPQHYKSTYQETTSTGEIEETAHVAIQPQQNIVEAKLNEGNFVFAENQRGVSFDKLIGPYIKDAKSIVITDPYIRLYYQARNLMEVIETIVKQKADDEEVEVTLITVADEIDPETQNEFLAKIRDNSSPVGVSFDWKFEDAKSIHARHIITDTGWKISLDRGLDIFQRFDMSDGLSISNRLQEFRACKGFEITYIKQ